MLATELAKLLLDAIAKYGDREVEFVVMHTGGDTVHTFDEFWMPGGSYSIRLCLNEEVEA